jgi:MFS family permease
MESNVSRMIPVGLFTSAASVGMVFALLHELQDEHDLSGTTLGWIAGTAFFAAVVAQLLLAPFADRGHARRVMTMAMLGASLGSLIFALASEPWQFIGARVITGLALGAMMPAAQAVVTAADPARAGERLGRLVGVQTAGFIIGPGIGALIVRAFGLDAPFYTLAVALLVLTPIMARIEVREVARPAPAGVLATSADMVRTMGRILRRRDALAATLVSAALLLPAGMYEAIWAIFLEDLGASTTFIGLSLALYGVPFILAAPYGGRLADRYGPLRVAPIALVVIVPLTIVYGFMTVPIMLMLFAMIEAVGNGLGMPAAQSLMAATTNEGERATGQGLAAAAGQLMAGITAVIAAPLFETHGPEWTFFSVAMAVLVVGGLGMAIGLSEDRSKRTVPGRTPRPLRLRGAGR